MKIFRFILFTILLVALTSCTLSKAQPTVTSTPEPTSPPTLTSTSTRLPTYTPLPATVTPTEIVLPPPVGTPAREWEGIPIMPGAIVGEGNSSGYRFITRATIEDVEAYYESVMVNLGWNPLVPGESGNGNAILIFLQGTDMASMAITKEEDGSTAVLIVKS